MVPDDPGHAAHPIRRGEDLLPDDGMLAHHHPLLFGELGGLSENLVGHTDLADVVEQGAPADLLDRRLVASERAGHFFGPHRDALAVTRRVVVTRVHRPGEAQDHLQIGILEVLEELGAADGRAPDVGDPLQEPYLGVGERTGGRPPVPAEGKRPDDLGLRPQRHDGRRADRSVGVQPDGQRLAAEVVRAVRRAGFGHSAKRAAGGGERLAPRFRRQPRHIHALESRALGFEQEQHSLLRAEEVHGLPDQDRIDRLRVLGDPEPLAQAEEHLQVGRPLGLLIVPPAVVDGVCCGQAERPERLLLDLGPLARGVVIAADETEDLPLAGERPVGQGAVPFDLGQLRDHRAVGQRRHVAVEERGGAVDPAAGDLQEIRLGPIHDASVGDRLGVAHHLRDVGLGQTPRPGTRDGSVGLPQVHRGAVGLAERERGLPDGLHHLGRGREAAERSAHRGHVGLDLKAVPDLQHR